MMNFDESNFSKKRKVLAEMNITPMVDIVFVLLIIFMVAAPMIEQGVDLDLPATETVPIESPKDKFVLRVLDNEKIYVDKIEIKIKDLEDKLKFNNRLQKEGEIYLYASKKLSYGYVVRIMAIAKKAGIAKISMVTEALEVE